jgi:hypothetical protein
VSNFTKKEKKLPEQELSALVLLRELSGDWSAWCIIEMKRASRSISLFFPGNLAQYPVYGNEFLSAIAHL